MSKIAPQLFRQFFDDNGDVLAYGLVYSYEAGTTTPKVTYTDSTEATANPNPIELDENGRAAIWLDTGAYKFVLHDSTDTPVGGSFGTIDKIVGEASNVFGASVTSVTGNLAVTDAYKNGVLDCNGTITLSLLDVDAAEEGFLFTVKNSGNGNVTVDPDASEQIDGASSISISPNESAIIVCDGEGWVSLFFYPVTGFADNEFRIQDNSDETKEIAFEASGITTGTTRTVTMPDKSGTLAMTDDTKGRYLETVVFTAGGSFSKASYPDARLARVTVIGAGGGGGGANSSATSVETAAAGGGGGGFSKEDILLSAMGASETVTIGTGGAAGSTSGTDGSAGGTTSFGSFLQATGGNGGDGTGNNASFDDRARPAEGGLGSGGDINGSGQSSSTGAGGTSGGDAAIGGSGGGTILGGGGIGGESQGTSNVNNATDGNAYGGGGGGASDTTASGMSGGDGADGVVIVELYS